MMKALKVLGIVVLSIMIILGFAIVVVNTINGKPSGFGFMVGLGGLSFFVEALISDLRKDD